MNKSKIISKDAKRYFKDNKVNRESVVDFITKKYNLEKGDCVFYEGNILGYTRYNSHSKVKARIS